MASAHDPVAIVAMGAAFPAGPGLDAFWRAILSRQSAAAEVPRARWGLDPNAIHGEDIAPDRVRSIRACLLPDLSLDLDGLALERARLERLDLSCRLAVHVARAAWTGARTGALDPRRAGVYIGNIALPTRAVSGLSDAVLDEALRACAGAPGDAGPARPDPLNRYVAGLPAAAIASALGLGGGSTALDAACASSLYAVGLGAAALRSRRLDAAIVGGLSRPDSLYTQMGFSQLRALSPSGRCTPFDARADGLVVGEGCGLFVLKRLADAERDGDRVLGVIAGLGLSNDIGANLMSPDGEGQQRAMRAAYRAAGWAADEVDHVECHGTGTPLGDAVEFSSLRALRPDAGGPACVIGSVKGNVGHLLTAAGSAGLAKTLMALGDGLLPPTAGFERAADGIDLAASPFEVLGEAREWPRRAPDAPRRAAVSAFGFGGINAHLLVEEHVPRADRARVAVSAPAPRREAAVSIVGADARLGEWGGLDAVRRRLLGGDAGARPSAPQGWWGHPSGADARGWFMPAVDVRAQRFRIPPTEAAKTLPQQLLMLEVAAGALDDAGLEPAFLAGRGDVGVFVGISLDLNTANFHLRWSAGERLAERLRAAGLDGDEPAAAEWLGAAREALGPPLDADRVMGALGSIVASRIARAFRIGGPSFVLCAEESSGLQALDAATRALRRGEVDVALVGAVDLAGDLRAVLGADGHRARSGRARPLDAEATGAVPGEGAVALVLTRAEDARRDRRRSYAEIRGIGIAGGGRLDGPDPGALVEARRRAAADAGLDAPRQDLVEVRASGDPAGDARDLAALAGWLPDRAPPAVLASASADVGETGAATGLVSVLKGALCLHHRVLPPLRGFANPAPGLAPLAGRWTAPARPVPWLVDRADAAPRRAAIQSAGVEGNAFHVILEESRPDEAAAPVEPDPRAGTLFAVESDDAAGLLAGLDALRRLHDARPGESLADLAEAWAAERPPAPAARLAVALVAGEGRALAPLAEDAAAAVRAERARADGGVWYAPEPLGDEGRLAFVYPGSGNPLAGMGAALGLAFPEVLTRLEAENERLRGQFAGGRFWHGGAAPGPADRDATHRDAIMGHVWIGALVTDVLGAIGVRPDAVLGYSLGESSSLVATRTWPDRDEMLRRIEASTLFTERLAGRCEAAREAWGLGDEAPPIDWLVGVVDRAADAVRAALAGRDRVYLLIVNTPGECVIGGSREAVLALVRELGGAFHPLPDVTTVHCEVARAVAPEYRALHVLGTRPVPGLRYYSAAWGRAYAPGPDACADSIVAQAVETFDFTRVVESAWADGARLFVEVGPGASCTRMIGRILGDRAHAVATACSRDAGHAGELVQAAALLLAHRVPVDTARLRRAVAPRGATAGTGPERPMRVEVGHPPFALPPLPRPAANVVALRPRAPGSGTGTAPTPRSPAPPVRGSAVRAVPSASPDAGAAPAPLEAAAGTAHARAHAAFLEANRGYVDLYARAAELHLRTVAEGRVHGAGAPVVPGTVSAPADRGPPPTPPRALDRDQCLEFATGAIGRVLGADFAPVDAFPTRVRLPDEPLMLVDRIVAIEGEPLSMTRGRVITEHDVRPDAWYLDGGRIPTCIAVEAGQADLFLSGWLGIDFLTRGLAVYRLLDAEVVFHGPLPAPGAVIRYDIHIDGFFRQGDMHLFRFRFEATADGAPLMSMRDGCAGFFTDAELAAGRGLVEAGARLAAPARAAAAPPPALVEMHAESLDDECLARLRAGDLAGCFGAAFEGLPLAHPATLPGGRMRLVHRVLELDPHGGAAGMGRIVGEADIAADDWFLTCHFVDDQVMPGTLMYECCLHTLRVFLLRRGWVGEADAVVFEPLPGVRSRLKCRGQVTAATARVQYDIEIKELGYADADGAPYAIADARMLADGRPIVEMRDMSMRLGGIDRAALERTWGARGAPRRALFDRTHFIAFASGRPSEAYGEPYRPFDDGTRQIARLPRPPFLFIDRITSIERCEPFRLAAGGRIEARYDVPPGAWYFDADGGSRMPYSVLLEAALQPCGWLAAYLGSALASDSDLRFRNLGGEATQHRQVTPETGTLTTTLTITDVSHSAGMIIERFDFALGCPDGPVLDGTTYFGFFTHDALARQVGIRGESPWRPAPGAGAESFPYPDGPGFPSGRMRMVDQVECYLPSGGPAGLGYLRGRTAVDPQAWFFEAHFHQDPVWPGSLGLDALLQLVRVHALRVLGAGAGAAPSFRAMADGTRHAWTYRGQVLPVDEAVAVHAEIKAVDADRRVIVADGLLEVDGRLIYTMRDFAVGLDR